MHWVTQSLPYNLNYNKISYPASRLLPVIQQARELARVSDLENKIDSLECHRMDLQQMLQNSEEQMPWYLDMEPETPKYDRIPVLVSSPSNGAHEYEFAALLGFEEDSHSESSYSEDISDSENSSHLAIGPGVQDVPADTMKPEPYHDLTSDDTIGTEVTSPDYTQPWIEHEVRNVSPPIQTERGFLSNIHQIWTPVNDPTMFPPSGAEYGQSTIYCQTSQIAAGDWVNQAALNIQQGQATFYCQPSQIGAGEWRNDASFISQGQSTTYYQPTQFIGGEWQNQATFNIQGQSTIFCQATEMGAGECGNQPAFNLQQGQPIIYCQPSGIGVGEWINQASFNIERDQSAIYFQPPQIGAVGGTHTIYNVQQSQSTIYYPPSHVGISEWPNQAAFNIQQSHAVIPCQPPAMGSAISTNSWRYTETHVEEQNQQVVILQGQKTVTSYTHTTYGQHPEPPRQHTIVPWPQPMRQNGLQQIPLIQDRNPNVQREEYTRGIWSRRPFMQSSERQDARPASRVNEANGGETSYYPPVRHAPAPRPREKPLLRQNAKWRETDNSSVRYIAPPLREQNSIPDHSSLRYVAPHRREKQDTEPPNARWIEPPDTAPKQYLAPHWRQRQGKKFGANWGWKDAPLGRGSDTTMQEKQDDRNAKWGHSDDVGRSLSDTPMLGKGASPKAIWTRKDNVQGAWRQGSPFMREEVIAPKEIKQAWCRADISSRSNSADPWREQRGNSNGNCDRKDDWRRRDVTEQEQENPETRTRANWGKDDASLSSTAVPTKEVPRLDSNASSVSAGREDKENKAEFIPRIILSRRMKYLERPDPATLQAEGCLERPSSSSDEIKATQAPAERKSTGFFTNKYKAGGSRPTANSFNDHDGARNPHRERVTPTSAINHGNVKFARNIGPSDAATCAETAQFTKDTTCAPWIAAGDGASSARAISPAGRPRAQDPANCLTTGTIPELSGKSISYAHPASNIAGTAKSIDICSRVGTTDHDIAPDADRLNLLYCRASADDNHSDPRNAGAHDVTAPDNGETAKGAAKDKGDTNRINQRDGGYAKDDIVKQIATKESAHIDGGAAEVAAKDFNCKDDGAVEATAGSTGPDKVVGNDIVRLANCNGITSNDPAAADTAADDGAIASVAGAASTTSGDVSDEEDLAGTEVLSGPSVAECRFSMNAEHKNKSEDTSWRCRESHHNSKIFLMRKLKRWGVPKRETSHNHRKNLRGRNNGAEPGRSRQSTTEEEANNENSRKIARNSTSEMQRDCKNICRKAPNNQNSRKQWNGARNVHFCGNKNVSRMPHNFTNSWKRPNHVKRTKWTQRDGYLQEEKNSTAGISCSYWNREKSKKMIAQSGSQHTHVRRTRTTHGKLPEEGSQGSVDRQENTATKSWLNSAKKIQMSSKHFQEERYFVPGCPQTEDTQTWRKASVSERKAPISWIRTSDGHLQQQSSSENQEVS